MKIRPLRSNDIPSLLELSQQAGWNQTQADWERMIALAPDACHGIEADDRIVSSTTGIRHGHDLAWIGMVLTHEAHRGRGYATALVQHAIDHLRDKVAWIKLDATDTGKPVYARLGFQDETEVQRWERKPGPVEKASSYLIHEYAVDPSFDRAYFGAYRVPLLNALRRDGESCFVVGYGYAMSRPGARARHLGPCVVRSTEAARALVEDVLAKHGGESVIWDLFPSNADAVRLAKQYGFQPMRHLTRMALPCRPDVLPILRNESSVFAIAGFEYG